MAIKLRGCRGSLSYFAHFCLCVDCLLIMIVVLYFYPVLWRGHTQCEAFAVVVYWVYMVFGVFGLIFSSFMRWCDWSIGLWCALLFVRG